MNDDSLIWAEYIKNIQPIKKKQSNEEIQLLNISRSRLKEIAITRSHNYYTQSINKVLNGTLNEDVLKKIDKNEIIIEQKIDLHNKTVDTARDLFFNFIVDCYNKKNRYVLVITGKGNKNLNQEYLKYRSDTKANYGILYNEFYAWVKEPFIQSLIVTFCHSNKRHGGTGAFYVLIKKNNAL